MRPHASLLLRVSPVVDALIVAGAFSLFWDESAFRSRVGLALLLLTVPLWLALLNAFGVYESQRVESLGALLRKFVTAQAVAAFAVLSVCLAVGAPGWGSAAAAVGVGSALVILHKMAVYAVLHRLRSRGHDVRRVCVIGTWERAEQIARVFDNRASWGLRVVCVGSGPIAARAFHRFPDRGLVAPDLPLLLNREVLDEVLIAVRPEQLTAESDTLRTCEQYGVMGRVLFEPSTAFPELSRVEHFAGEVTLGAGPAVNELSITAKRVLDLIGATLLLVITAPILVLAGLLVKLSSPGPVLFRQDRVGLHGRRFTLYKFRTMIDGAESLRPSLAHRSIAGGPIFKDPHDFRITPMGRFLRRFSIDELPQLLNVLKGEMSLVGPRPLPVHESAAIEGPYRRRFSMRPGITCLWQVNGRSDVDYKAWMEYDLQYVDRWSLVLDAKLLLRTIPAVINGRGAY